MEPRLIIRLKPRGQVRCEPEGTVLCLCKLVLWVTHTIEVSVRLFWHVKDSEFICEPEEQELSLLWDSGPPPLPPK